MACICVTPRSRIASSTACARPRTTNSCSKLARRTPGMVGTEAAVREVLHTSWARLQSRTSTLEHADPWQIAIVHLL